MLDNAKPQPILESKNLHLYYGETEALKGIDMKIGKNEITALIGPSGCGKSTFLKTLNRMNDLIPSVRITGEVTLQGKDIFAPDVDVTALRRQVGMVFQKPNPFPMSIYDNIAYGPRLHGNHKGHELDEIVENALRGAALWDEVKDRLKKSALGLSGGQQQRLCIARTGRTAGCTAHGRAHLGARPRQHPAYRGPDGRAQKELHGRHRHP